MNSKRSFYFILIIINVLIWNYYLSNYTNFYKNIFYNDYQKTIDLNLSFFDVASGNTCFIKTPIGKNILLDADFNRSNRNNKNVIFNYLKNNNINSLDKIIITNSNSHNILNILSILRSVPVGEVIDCMGSVGNRNVSKLRYFLSRHPEIGHYKPRVNDVLDLDPFIKIEVMGLKDKFISKPMLFKLIYNKFSLIFTQDLNEKDMMMLTHYKDKLHSTLLRYIDNNNKLKYLIPFYSFIKPEAFIISGIDDSKYGINDYEVWDYRVLFNSKIYYTKYDGNISVNTNGEKYTIITKI